jgi:gluconate kinase
MQQRVGHYMQPGLLDSQLQTLEKPTAEESDVITLSIDQPIDQIVRQALESLKTTSINALP